MKKIIWVFIPMVVIALAIGFSGCSAKEGAAPRAKAKQEGSAQPVAKTEPSSTETDQRAQVQAPAPQSDDNAAPQTANAPSDEMTKPEVAEITGTVMDASGEIQMSINNENYAVTGEDLSEMVGKTVRVLGSLQEAEGQKTIKVLSIFEVK